LTPHSVMLIYLSADASDSHLKSKIDRKWQPKCTRFSRKVKKLNVFLF
jgi:hypothetical protein